MQCNTKIEDIFTIIILGEREGKEREGEKQRGKEGKEREREIEIHMSMHLLLYHSHVFDILHVIIKNRQQLIHHLLKGHINSRIIRKIGI